ncbi:MAG: GNAT family N-acetyltransferase [Synechococcales bacterium]|nr:GNAT family N-acetyltransferase [Synechococcales bacterium]
MTCLLSYQTSSQREPSQVTIRPARIQDVPLILDFIHKKAEFERNLGAFSGMLNLSEALLAQTLFGKHPFAYVLLAEIKNQPVGYLLYFFKYASFLGIPSIWVDDVYVDEHLRGKGIGSSLMQMIAQIGRENHCRMLAWITDRRNLQGLKFYNRLGAQLHDQNGNDCTMRWYL